eukprot:CAMPEP_0176142028 /NCGR_PEP_ID=MMETSP0120_2-20121206/72243_1 /TAXON_ID=160619 /ORGANISM="Kryptoperidinium foliaceum, Strain CCMP 1326" /LENGTH=66 /DNA_ID=CAMNT_0017478219 /DNA_START=45 /DNA_END=241 /DNA_ORIENTATION=-
MTNDDMDAVMVTPPPAIPSPSPGPNTISTPGPKDVLLGKGRRGEKNPGNLVLRRLLEENYDSYDKG